MAQASEKFDIVLARVREYQALQERIPAVRVDTEINGGPAKVGNAMAEFIGDFVLAGKRALRRWPPRAEVFELYYVRNLPRAEVLKMLRLQEGTLNWWSVEIKKAVGAELGRRGLYPPSRYTRRVPNWREESEEAR